MAEGLPVAAPEDESEVERLRSRIRELEAELMEAEQRANRAVAEAQERVYWLDRWNLDLNALMARPGAAELRGAIRLLRSAVRVLRRLGRSLKRPR